VDEPKRPPSLSRVWGAAAAEQSERDARERKIEEALRSLPLTDDARSKVPKFVSLFEATYGAVKRQKDDHPASGALVERELSDLVRKCDSLRDHLIGMHRDTISAWVGGGGITDSSGGVGVINVAALVAELDKAAEWAQRALAANKTARRAAKRGNPGDAMAAAMRDTAAFVYTKLMGKRPGRAYNPYKSEERDTKFIKLLRRIYEVYAVRASARSRARQRQRPMGNNSKK
jgi:hypothetical protein